MAVVRKRKPAKKKVAKKKVAGMTSATRKPVTRKTAVRKKTTTKKAAKRTTIIVSLLLFGFTAMTAFAVKTKTPEPVRRIDPRVTKAVQYSFPDALIKSEPALAMELQKYALGEPMEPIGLWKLPLRILTTATSNGMPPDQINIRQSTSWDSKRVPWSVWWGVVESSNTRNVQRNLFAFLSGYSDWRIIWNVQWIRCSTLWTISDGRSKWISESARSPGLGTLKLPQTRLAFWNQKNWRPGTVG